MGLQNWNRELGVEWAGGEGFQVAEMFAECRLLGFP